MTAYKRDYQYDYNLLGIYLKDIGGIKPLTGKKERILAQKKDGESLNELIRRNLKYVITVANRYKGCGLSLPDLIGEGNIGLIQAAKRFDHLRGVKFITYAVWWIRQSIMQALAEHSGSISLPLKQAGILYKISRKYRELFQLYKREPTMEEIAKALNISSGEVEALMRVYRSHLSLDAHLRDGDDTTYLDMLEDFARHPIEENLIYDSLRRETDALINELAPREKEILRMRFGFYGESMTLQEIGEKIGLSRERVRQIEKNVKKKLLSKAKKMDLKDYLD